MGNCLRMIVGEDEYPLIENSDTITHQLEVNREAILALNKRIDELETNNNDVFKSITQDLRYLNEKIINNSAQSSLSDTKNVYLDTIINVDGLAPNHSSFNHQLSSKYGGNSPESIQADDDGPLFKSANT